MWYRAWCKIFTHIEEESCSDFHIMGLLCNTVIYLREAMSCISLPTNTHRMLVVVLVSYLFSVYHTCTERC